MCDWLIAIETEHSEYIIFININYFYHLAIFRGFLEKKKIVSFYFVQKLYNHQSSYLRFFEF